MLTITTDPTVYSPREDTYVLLEALNREPLSGRGLEIGVGTGIIALHICNYFDEFIGVDINPRAVDLAVHNAEINHIKNVCFFYSDLFSHVSGVFDVIIFNPPYVPADEKITIENLSYHGGKDGRRTLDQFLSEIPPYMPDGTAYFLQSSLSGLEKTCSMLQDTFSFTVIARKKLFFEELYVFKIKRRIS